MKNQSIAITGIVVASIAVVVALFLFKNNKATEEPVMTISDLAPILEHDSDTDELQEQQASTAERPAHPAPHPLSPAPHPLSKVDSEIAFKSLLESVLLIQDHHERLQAIRARLGMGISDTIYQEILEKYGYQNKPRKLAHLMVEHWLRDDPTAVAEWAQGFGDADLKDHFTMLAITQWMNTDRAAATQWAEQHGIHPDAIENAATRSAALDEALTDKQSPPRLDDLMNMQLRLLALSQQDPSPQDPSQLLERINLNAQIKKSVAALAATDPLASMEFVNSIEDPQRRESLYHTVLKTWAVSDPDGMLVEVKQFQAAKQREQALLEALPAWQLKYPERSIDEVIDVDTIGDAAYNSIFRRIVRDMAFEDPSHAMNYALVIKDPAMRNRMVSDVAKRWATITPGEVPPEITSMPTGEIRDRTISGFATVRAKTDFDQAVLLLDHIENRELRDEAVSSVLASSRIISRSFEDALGLVDQLPSISSMDAMSWANRISAEDAPAFRSWLKQAYDSDRITHEAYPDPPEGSTPAYVEQVMEANRKARAQVYRQTLNSLDNHLERK